MNGYTQSLGGMETPGSLVVARIPSAIVSMCVFTSVAKCVLKRAHSVSEMARMSNMACLSTCVKRRRFQIGRREQRAEWAAGSYFENRAGFMGRRVWGPFGR